MPRWTILALVMALMMAISDTWAGLDEGKRLPEDFPSDVASAWFETLYDVVKMEKTLPPSASRIYGITSVVLYEAVVGGSLTHRSLVGQLNNFDSLPTTRPGKTPHWPTVANTALAAAVRGLYPTASQSSMDRINSQEIELASHFQQEVTESVYTGSVRLGLDVARAVLEWAATDGFFVYNNCRYVPAPVRGAWKPTPPTFATNPTQPCWGQMRTMVLKSGAECAPPGNPPFSSDPSSPFYAAALKVHDVGMHLSPDQKTIADYWADGVGATGTPPGHWIAIVAQIARNKRLSLMAAAEAFARVGIAVHDAFVVCWRAKYVYNLQRPITYIRFYIDPNWLPYITTPAFPSYHSGHSTQSGAAAAVLTDLFGTMAFTDTTHADHRLIPPQHSRSFSSFKAAAQEAAVSRLFGGIHYTFDNDDGLSSGECVGEHVRNRLTFKK